MAPAQSASKTKPGEKKMRISANINGHTFDYEPTLYNACTIDGIIHTGLMLENEKRIKMAHEALALWTEKISKLASVIVESR